jgi:Spy/CpxP family protein refolding chaperone
MVTARRARLLSVLIIAIVFLVGGLTGAATMHVVEGDEAPRAERRERGPRGSRDLFERLQLTPEQQVQVEAIMEQGRTQMDAFWAEHRPALRAIADSTRAQIRAVLTPEQRALDDEWMAERRREAEKRGDDGRGGRDGR